MEKLYDWVCSALQNAGIGSMIAGLVLLGTASTASSESVLWGAVLLVVGSIMLGVSFGMVCYDVLKGDSK